MVKIPRLLVSATPVSSNKKSAKAGLPDTDLLVLFQESGKDGDKKPAPLSGPYASTVDQLRDGHSFDAGHGSTEYIRFGGKRSTENVLFIGLGAEKDLTHEKVRSCGGTAWSKLMAVKSLHVALHIDRSWLRPFAEGLVLAAYRFDKYKTKKSKKGEPEYQGPEKIVFSISDKSLNKEIQAELDEIVAMAEAVQVARNWSNEPSNIGTPQYFANEAQKMARTYGLKSRTLTLKDATREKMGLFVGVGQGSKREGRIVVLEYNPKGVKRAKTIALVGKGVTFDSGGISLKPSGRMEEMKHDMTGAATVMGTILLAAQWQVRNRVIAIMAFTENMPSGNAIQPGNILHSRAGKTVEVVNTDAEGRLILADVLDYAQDYKPDAIIDVATLTGAVAIALGKQCCAVLGNNDELIHRLRQASEHTGERIWQLPLFDEYFDDLKSDCADMKNSANDSYGGTIRGAIFLKQFVKKSMPWAHLDIATMATGLGHIPYYPKKGASGIYVRTLAQLVADY